MKSHHICPSCKAVLEFDRAKLSVVKCPKCAYTGNVAVFKEKAVIPDTEMNPQLSKLGKPGMLEFLESDVPWLATETTVNLQPGINTIGRQSPNSTATIQLPTTDTFMSRVHATIEVIKKAEDDFEHRLYDNGSKNSTFHNEKSLEKNDVIILARNDTIRLGRTLLRLVGSLPGVSEP